MISEFRRCFEMLTSRRRAILPELPCAMIRYIADKLHLPKISIEFKYILQFHVLLVTCRRIVLPFLILN